MVRKNKIRQNLGDMVFGAVDYLLITFATLLTLYPLIYVVMASFSNSDLLMGHRGLLWWPIKATVAAYKAILTYPSVWSGYRNTLFILVFGLLVSLCLTILGAYFMSRKGVLFGKVFAFMALFTMYFSGGLVPLYLNVKSLGLYDSLWGVILVSGLSTYNMIILRTNFQSIPAAVEESASIDGANDLVILCRIILPLSGSAIAVMVLYYGVAFWNSWFHPMILLQDKTKIPLQLVLRDLLIKNQTQQLSESQSTASIEQTVKFAVIVISTLPLLCVYPFLQKYFVKGVMIGSVKG